MTYSSVQRTLLFTDAEGLSLRKRKIIHTLHTKHEMKVDSNEHMWSLKCSILST